MLMMVVEIICLSTGCIYARSLIPGNSVVAILCFILYGCHTAMAQSRWDLTIIL